MPDSGDNVNARDGASIEWGPEIRVDGKRPEWLADNIAVAWCYKSGQVESECRSGSLDFGTGMSWQVNFIRLPADHPHYRQPTTPELDPALWDRMVALVRSMALSNGAESVALGHYFSEARAITKDIVSDELREAREVCAQASIRAGQKDQADEYRNGRWDDGYTMDVAKLALRRGRQLATPEVSHVG